MTKRREARRSSAVTNRDRRRAVEVRKREKEKQPTIRLNFERPPKSLMTLVL